MEKSTKNLSSTDIRQRLNQIKDKPALSAAPTPQRISVDYNSPYLEAAAVLIFFEPESINPTKPDQSKSEKGNRLRNELVGSSKLMIDSRKNVITGNRVSGAVKNSQDDDGISYTLKDEVRIKILDRLFREGSIEQALGANKDQAYNESDVLQAMFTRCLLKDIPKPETLNLEQLNSLCQVTEWLGHLQEMPSREKLRYQIQMMEMLAPFKHLTGKYIDGEFHEQFRGRQDKLSDLRKYVGIKPPQGYLETFERTVLEKIFDFSKKPPLLIYGLGGIGKSTLLAKFILDHLESHEQDRFPFVYLDFDRPNLSALEHDTLLIEAARQLSIQYNDQKNFFEEATKFYEKWKGVYSSLTDTSNTEFVSIKSDVVSQQYIKDRQEIMLEFISLIEGLSKINSNRPFLMILDTFEEVQYKGADYVDEMYSFMKQMQQKYPLLRTVVAGRAPVTNFKTEEMELTELDPEAAEAYILKFGGLSPEEASLIVKRVGGNPLTLKLAAEVVKELGMEELKNTQLTQKRFLFFDKRLSELQIQGILYERILGHIKNPNVYKLAHPGLVLRTITPELILHVLNKPCELGIKSIEEARVLFEETGREVSLIRVEGNMLRHRPDVRKVMLQLIRKSKPEIVKEIQELAIAYYSKLNGKAERAEEIYHRLSLDESPRELESRWVDGIQNYLMGSIDELPARAQAYLSARTGIESIDPSIWNSADLEDKERRAVRQVADLLNSGLAEKALELINKNKKDLRGGILSLFEVKALSNLGQFQEALDKTEQILHDDTIILKPEIRTELENYIVKLTQSLEYMDPDKNNEEEDQFETKKGNINPEDFNKGFQSGSHEMDNYAL